MATTEERREAFRAHNRKLAAAAAQSDRDEVERRRKFGPYFSIDEIKRANADHGHHFFERSTMRFFGSRVSQTVIGGRYFLTSEARPALGDIDRGGPRLYTLRAALESGEVETLGGFQAFETRARALGALRRALEAGSAEVRFDPYPKHEGYRDGRAVEVPNPLREENADREHFHWRVFVGELASDTRIAYADACELARELSGVSR